MLFDVLKYGIGGVLSYRDTAYKRRLLYAFRPTLNLADKKALSTWICKFKTNYKPTQTLRKKFANLSCHNFFRHICQQRLTRAFSGTIHTILAICEANYML